MKQFGKPPAGSLVYTCEPNGYALTFTCEEVLAEEGSPFQKIGFYKTKSHGTIMLLDDLMMLTEYDEHMYHEPLVHVPLFSHPHPKRVLIVGGGDCGAIRECLKHPSVEEVHLCEIDGRVVELTRQFFPWGEAAVSDKRTSVHIGDGFEFMKRTSENGLFDVIIVDLSDPSWGDVENPEAARLFTEEFFQLVKGALTADGILIGQCESATDSIDMITDVHSDLGSVFPHVHFYTSTVASFSGLWCFYFASDSINPMRDFDRERYRKLAPSMNLRYYTDAMHKAAFVLPAELQCALNKEAVIPAQTVCHPALQS